MRIARTGAIGDIETEDEQRAQYARWSRLAREGHQVPDYSPAEIESELALRSKGYDVGIVEFLELTDGRRITAPPELGYSAGWASTVSVPHGEAPPEVAHPWSATTPDEVRETIRCVVEADADDVLEDADFDEGLSGYAAAAAAGLGDDWLRVRWARLAMAAATEGISVSPEELQAAPFEVELTERLLAERERHVR
jgi:hypothetical protein